MAADLGFVAHAAERHPHELSAEGARDRPPERRFANSRRPDQAQNRPVDALDEREHADVVENPVLHVLEAMVILVEHAPRVGDVHDVVGSLGPRQRENPFHVAADDSRFGRERRQAPQPARFAAGARLHQLGERALLDLGFELRRVRAVVFAELAVNRLQLLLEIELALVLDERPADLVVELSFEAQHLDFGADHVVQLAEEIGQRVSLEQALPRLVSDRQMRGDAVRLAFRRIGRLNHRHDLARNAAMERDVFLEVGHRAPGNRANVGDVLWRLVARVGEHGAHDAAGMGIARNAGPGDALDEDARGAVRLLRHLRDARHDADAVQVGRRRIFDVRVALGDEHQRAV